MGCISSGDAQTTGAIPNQRHTRMPARQGIPMAVEGQRWRTAARPDQRLLRWGETTRCAPSEAAAEPPLLTTQPNLDHGFETPGPSAHPRQPNHSPELAQRSIVGKRSVPPPPKLDSLIHPPSTHLPHTQFSFAAEQTGEIPCLQSQIISQSFSVH